MGRGRSASIWEDEDNSKMEDNFKEYVRMRGTQEVRKINLALSGVKEEKKNPAFQIFFKDAKIMFYLN